MSWRKTEKLMDTIRHYASFPATGVSLRQMVQFGEKPSTGTLFRASQFLAEELPIRLAHRVQELDNLPDGLNEMPSVKRVQDWYAQSFEVSNALVPLASAHPDVLLTVCRKSPPSLDQN